uniref:prostatic acid phosphatase-like n=1 Tax=Styela clava TaxID=7725 RepID=UPI00193A8B69|nr:prostatic acid phosphatase-like [Styela clava]
MSKICCCSTIIFIIIWMHAVKGVKELVFVNIVWRHGDRSYIKSYPNDPYKNGSIWKNGPGELTNIGIKQQYELGKFLRSRYDIILSKAYRPQEIYVRSTDKDRTIMSAQSNMAGLYPPVTSDELWNGSNTEWYPVPIHVVPLESDNLLRYPIRGCPKYEKVMHDIHNSPWFIAHEKNYSSFYGYIQKNTGSTYRYNFSNIWEVEDNLFCLKSNNFSLPHWVKNEDLQKLKFLNSLDMGVMFSDVDYKYRSVISQMQGGVLLKEMIQNMTQHINNISKYSTIAYSAHDTTLTALLVTLGNYDWIQPEYASCIMIELYKDSDKYFVEIFYKKRNGTKALKFFNCNISCPFDDFVTIAKQLIPDDYGKICGKHQEPFSCNKIVLIAVCCILALFILIFIIYVSWKCSKKAKRDFPYSIVETTDDDGPI